MTHEERVKKGARHFKDALYSREVVNYTDG